MRDAKTVLTQDVSSGKVHERVYLDGRLLSSEQCNLDQAGKFRIIEELADDADLCRLCFPRPADDTVPG